MTRSADYQARIETYGQAQLLQLWEAIKKQTPLPDWPAGKALEYLVLRAFQLEGADVVYPYEVKVTDMTSDYRHASTIGLLFSRSGFTQPAMILARYLGPQMVLLWGSDQIQYGLEHQRMGFLLVEKYRACIEKGVPDFDARFEVRP